MIIPSLHFPEFETKDIESIVDSVRRWSLLGTLAIRGVSSRHLETLTEVVLRTSGNVDLWLQFDELNEAEAIELANTGAARILATPQQSESAQQIPLDRFVHWMDDPSPDEAIPPRFVVALNEPAVARLVELEMARIDALVDVGALEARPELIVELLTEVLVSDRPDGLWSTVIVDPMGVALGLAYSDRESLAYAIEHRVGAYHSRSRNELWVKGETSGATQSLIGLRLDCDRDCLRFQVTQDAPGFCHLQNHTCFGTQRTLQSVVQRLEERLTDTDEKSFTRKLAADAEMLRTKLVEEAGELAEATHVKDTAEVTWEAADVLYFSLVAMLKRGVTLADVQAELARRMNRIVRRKNKLESNPS